MQLIEQANLEVIYEAERLYLAANYPKLSPPPLEQFRSRYANAPGVSFMHGDLCVGGIVVHDRLAHIGVLPEYHGAWARLWPAAYRWMFGICDPVYAMVQPSNRKVVALVRRTGGKFVKNVKVPQMGSMMLYALSDSTTPYPPTAAQRRVSLESPSAAQHTLESTLGTPAISPGASCCA